MITVEPVVDAPEKRGLLRRAREKLTPRDPVNELAIALVGVRAIVQKHAQASEGAKRRVDNVVAAIEQAKSVAGKAWVAVEEGKGAAALCEWAGAMLAIEKGAPESIRLQPTRFQVIAISESHRNSIKKACALQIKVAELELDPERVKEKQRQLSQAGDYDAVSHVREEALKAVATWKGRLEELDKKDLYPDTGVETDRFLSVAKLLLEGLGSIKGSYIHKKDGNIYVLERAEAVADSDLAAFEHTHALRSPTGYWEGTEEQFNEQFQKV